MNNQACNQFRNETWKYSICVSAFMWHSILLIIKMKCPFFSFCQMSDGFILIVIIFIHRMYENGRYYYKSLVYSMASWPKPKKKKKEKGRKYCKCQIFYLWLTKMYRIWLKSSVKYNDSIRNRKNENKTYKRTLCTFNIYITWIQYFPFHFLLYTKKKKKQKKWKL